MRPEHWLFTIPLRLRSLFRGAQVDQELDDELRDHLERKTEEYVTKGMTPEEAPRQARLDLCGVEKVKEECRDARRVKRIQDFMQDLRYGLRILRKNPGSTAAVVITLALGIGLNTTVFSFVNALLLRPPARVKAPDQLREVWIHNPRSSGLVSYLPLTYPDYLYYRDHNQSFEGLLAYDGDPHLVIWNRSAEGQTVLGQLVSGNFFSLLGVNPILGRTISAEDDQTANPQPVVVLGYGFGADTSVLISQLSEKLSC